MKIKSVAVFGAGAVGSYVIWGLSDVKDIKLGVIAQVREIKSLRLMAVRLMVMYTVQKYGHLTKPKVLIY